MLTADTAIYMHDSTNTVTPMTASETSQTNIPAPTNPVTPYDDQWDFMAPTYPATPYIPSEMSQLVHDTI
jgi:hypothetical protein